MKESNFENSLNNNSKESKGDFSWSEDKKEEEDKLSADKTAESVSDSGEKIEGDKEKAEIDIEKEMKEEKVEKTVSRLKGLKEEIEETKAYIEELNNRYKEIRFDNDDQEIAMRIVGEKEEEVKAMEEERRELTDKLINQLEKNRMKEESENKEKVNKGKNEKEEANSEEKGVKEDVEEEIHSSSETKREKERMGEFEKETEEMLKEIDNEKEEANSEEKGVKEDVEEEKVKTKEEEKMEVIKKEISLLSEEINDLEHPFSDDILKLNPSEIEGYLNSYIEKRLDPNSEEYSEIEESVAGEMIGRIEYEVLPKINDLLEELARKEDFTDKEMEIISKYRSKFERFKKELLEKKESSKERKEEFAKLQKKFDEWEKSKKDAEQEAEESEKEQESNEKEIEGLPEDLAEYLEEKTFGEKNKSVLKKALMKSRGLGAALGGALGLKWIATKTPYLGEVIKGTGKVGTGIGGAIAGVGLKAGSYAIEWRDERKKYREVRDELNYEINDSQEKPGEVIKERMKDLDTDIAIVEGKLEKLREEKKKLKEDGVWFFQRERREMSTEIKKHIKVLESARDEFRYLSVEMKRREPEVDVIDLTNHLLEERKNQLEKLASKGGPHAALLKEMLAELDKESSNEWHKTAKKIKGAETGLKAKLRQENRSMAKEILISAGALSVLSVAFEYALEAEPVQDKINEVSEWFSERMSSPERVPGPIEPGSEELMGEFSSELDKEVFERVSEPASEELMGEFSSELDKGVFKGVSEPASEELMGEFSSELDKEIISEGEKMIEETLEEINSDLFRISAEAAEMETVYTAESGDSVWSLSEDFLSENLDSFNELSSEDKNYILDHIRRVVEQDPSRFGLDPGQSIDQIAIGQEIDFTYLLEGELEVALEKVEGLAETVVEAEEAIAEAPEATKPEAVEVSDPIAEAAEVEVESSINTQNEAEIEDWLARMHKDEIGPVGYEQVLADQEWVEFLAEKEGVGIEEMEELLKEKRSAAQEAIKSGSEELLRESAVEAGTETALETGEVAESVAEMNQNLDKVKSGEMTGEEFLEELHSEKWKEEVLSDPTVGDYFYEGLVEEFERDLQRIVPETGPYEISYSGEITPFLRQQFAENFNSYFGTEISSVLPEGDIVDMLKTGEISTGEFLDWMESSFDGFKMGETVARREDLLRALETYLEMAKNPSSREVYRSMTRALEMRVRSFLVLM